MTIKDIANEIFLDKVKSYLRYDTFSAKHHGFICKFSDEDFGINLLNLKTDKLLEYMEGMDQKSFKYIKNYISEHLGEFDHIYIIYFVLFHEEGHWLEFLASNMTGEAYCKQISLDYDGQLMNDLSDEEFPLVYRSNSYEKRADEYAIKRLKEYISNL